MLDFAHSHFEKILEITNSYGNSHCVNALQASRYLCVLDKKLVPIFSEGPIQKSYLLEKANFHRENGCGQQWFFGHL